MTSIASAQTFASGVDEIAPDPLPLYDPARPAAKLRPLKAWHHFRELLKNKENTEEVFHIFQALPWKGMRPASERFLTTERGRALRISEPYLVPMLDDHQALRRMPAGSVAHAYCDFMEREGLSAQGLVDEHDKFAAQFPKFHDQLQWYMTRARDTHDLLHVLTGYGRDALGEACVLAFTYSQQPAPAHLFIGYMAGLNIRKQTGGGKVPVIAAIREGQRLGKACPRLIEMPIREVLALPLEEARRRLNITPAEHYRRAHEMWRAKGIDPYDLLNQRNAV